MNWTTKWRWNTDYSADSVEWCPLEPYRHVLVCGTYQLHKNNHPDHYEEKQTRIGKIYLFAINEVTTELSPIQTIRTAGVLDQKWCYHTISNYPVLAAVTSIGTIELYQLVNEDGSMSLKLWMEHSIGENTLILSLDWSTNKTQSEEPRIVISDSLGNVTVLRVAGDGLEELGKWTSHGFEAWTTAFNYWNPNVFYSGGDDCSFNSYDVRVEEAVVHRGGHISGVTAMRNRMDVEHEILTGSYDERLRYWDTRKLDVKLSEVDANGGIWRIKYHPTRPRLVLAACMYGGVKLVEADRVVSEYKEHESIAYGADWAHAGGLLATCSFYDCKLHVSEVSFAN